MLGDAVLKGTVRGEYEERGELEQLVAEDWGWSAADVAKKRDKAEERACSA